MVTDLKYTTWKTQVRAAWPAGQISFPKVVTIPFAKFLLSVKNRNDTPIGCTFFFQILIFTTTIVNVVLKYLSKKNGWFLTKSAKDNYQCQMNQMTKKKRISKYKTRIKLASFRELTWSLNIQVDQLWFYFKCKKGVN